MKSFEKWETEEVEMTFGIKFRREKESMKKWITFQTALSTKENEILEELNIFLIDFVDFWNEEDLKAFFIIPLTNMIHFFQFEKYRTFMEATFEAEVKDIKNEIHKLRGRVEMVVATGKQKPQTPFFFLNEYKAQLKAITDPKGQLLVAMLAAQTKNNGINLPIYGMYNIGQNFFFLILEGNEYTISKQFDATDKQDLEQIVYMLKFVKNHIENYIKTNL